MPCPRRRLRREAIIKKRADINAENKNGKTPLDLAVGAGNRTMVKCLEKHGGKANKTTKKESTRREGTRASEGARAGGSESGGSETDSLSRKPVREGESE